MQKKKSGMSLSIGLFKIYFYSNKFFILGNLFLFFYSWKPELYMEVSLKVNSLTFQMYNSKIEK